MVQCLLNLLLNGQTFQWAPNKKNKQKVYLTMKENINRITQWSLHFQYFVEEFYIDEISENFNFCGRYFNILLTVHYTHGLLHLLLFLINRPFNLMIFFIDKWNIFKRWYFEGFCYFNLTLNDIILKTKTLPKTI